MRINDKWELTRDRFNWIARETVTRKKRGSNEEYQGVRDRYYANPEQALQRIARESADPTTAESFIASLHAITADIARAAKNIGGRT